jgi:hypothetical protein
MPEVDINSSGKGEGEMRRPGQIALVFAMAAMASVTVAAQEATPIGQKRAGAPVGTSVEAETEAGTGACDNSVSRSTSGGGLIKRYKLAYLYALTEYNPFTCDPIDPGAWTLTHQQICKPPFGGPEVNCGTVTLGTLTNLALGNGDCPGHTYNFASICYTWDEHIDWKIKDKIKATWNSTDFSMPMVFPVNVKIKYPTSETTIWANLGDAGIGQWKQTLRNADPIFDWSGNSVQETDPGPDNAANDTCWCPGSAIGQFYKITGGVWYGPATMAGGDFGPKKNGKWGYDHVGWCASHGAFFCSNAAFPVPVDYYRLKQRAPCGTTFLQQMQFQATNAGDTSWKNYGAVNTLGGSFTDVDITSLRAGMSHTDPDNPVPIMPRLACRVPFTKVAAAAAAFGASVVVSDPRPVAAAIEEIEKLSGRPITYEDPPILNKDYMMPMVEGGDPRLLVPRGGSSLRFTLPADASAEQKVAAAQSMVGTYNASHGAATFSVSQDGLTHVVPRQTMDASGRLTPVTPVLGTRITVAAKPRSAMELLGEICQAVSRVSGQPVGIGTVPNNALLQQTIEIGANNEPAREVLEKLIMANRLTLSWRLLYDPGLKTYYLNIPVIRWPSNPP